MPKFRKKPVVIEAVQLTEEALRGTVFDDFAVKTGCDPDSPTRDYFPFIALLIPTLEGVMEAKMGDWIITGVNGEKYPCKPDIFEKTYEPAE